MSYPSSFPCINPEIIDNLDFDKIRGILGKHHNNTRMKRWLDENGPIRLIEHRRTVVQAIRKVHPEITEDTILGYMPWPLPKDEDETVTKTSCAKEDLEFGMFLKEYFNLSNSVQQRVHNVISQLQG